MAGSTGSSVKFLTIRRFRTTSLNCIVAPVVSRFLDGFQAPVLDCLAGAAMIASAGAETVSRGGSIDVDN